MAEADTTAKTVNVISIGYYYFDGTIWQTSKAPEAWRVSGTTHDASSNYQNIYQLGKVCINKNTVFTSQLDVTGDFKANYANEGINNGTNTNYVGLCVPTNIMYVANNEDLVSSTNSSIAFFTPDLASIQSNKLTGGGSISAYSTINGGNVGMYANSAVANTISLIWGYNTNSTKNYVELANKRNGAEATVVLVEKLSGVNFSFQTPANAFEGSYSFPRNNGTTNQVLTTNGTVGTNSQLS